MTALKDEWQINNPLMLNSCLSKNNDWLNESVSNLIEKMNDWMNYWANAWMNKRIFEQIEKY